MSISESDLPQPHDAAPMSSPGDPITSPQTHAAAPIEPENYLPARMVNEAVYCPRLFYFMHVEGQFDHNQYTADGSAVHKRVDAKTDPLQTPTPDRSQATPRDLFADQWDSQADAGGDHNHAGGDHNHVGDFISEGRHVPQEPADESSQSPPVRETIHARSVTLAHDELGVVAKLDLVEATGEVATPVDYKRGRPRRVGDGTISAWPPERVQICLQALVLQENGFRCDEGILYFNETRQRVRIKIDDDLIQQTRQAVDEARRLSELPMPPAPLVASSKCPKCSLSPICLPDETNACRAKVDTQGNTSDRPIRLPTTPRDDQRPLYLNTQGLWVGKSGEVLQIKDNGKLVQEVRLREVNQVNLFGNIQVSTQAMQTLLQLDVPLVMFSSHGYFRGMLQGTGLKNILLRREQFRMADDARRSLQLARLLIEAKIRNCRVLLMRNHIDPPKAVIGQLRRISQRLHRAQRADQLLGIEGTAARMYFEHFSGMIKVGDSPANPAAALDTPPRWTFEFRNRNRRPPRDPVNAMLSLAYSLLAKDMTVTAAAVGLDPYLGFYHLPRPGRPALSLDMMEPFRPLIAESVVIAAINNRMVTPEHFIAAGRGVSMTESGRKAFLRAYELRMDQLVTHPLFDYRVSYRRLLDIQTRLMARMITGEIETFPVFVSR